MGKGCLIGCGLAALAAVGLVAAFALIGVGVFALTGGAAEAADEFLSLVGTGKLSEAYDSTAEAFRKQESEESFTAFVEQTGLSEYRSASWMNRAVDNKLATLEGDVTTRSGGTIPLTVELVKENGTWKVLSVSGKRAGAATVDAKLRIPADDELQELAAQSLADFSDAVAAKDFAGFHEKLAVLWQREITPEQLTDAFHEFIDNEIDLRGVKDVAPVFDAEPVIDDRNLLVLSGYMPTSPSLVRFALSYAYEHPEWKLAGIQVNVTEQPQAEEGDVEVDESSTLETP